MLLAKQKLKFDRENAQNNQEFQFRISETEKNVFKNKQEAEEYNSQLVHQNSELTNTNTILNSEKELLKNELKLAEKNLSDSRAYINELDEKLNKEITEKENFQNQNHEFKQKEIDFHGKIDELIRQKNELTNAIDNITKQNRM